MACLGFISAAAGQVGTLQRYAAGLEAAGANHQAVLEFKRMLFFSRSREDSVQARSGLLRNLEASGLPEEAYAQSRALLLMASEGRGREAQEWNGLRLLSKQANLGPAREAAYALLEADPSPELRILALKILAALEIAENQPAEALRWAGHLASACNVSPPGWKDSLSSLLMRPPPKRPLLAGVLSGIVPGSGQAYAGAYAGAFNSLALNGILGYGLIHGFGQGRWGDIFLYLTLFERFYVGGIKVAMARAEDVNLADSKQKRLRALEWIDSVCPETAVRNP